MNLQGGKIDGGGSTFEFSLNCLFCLIFGELKKAKKRKIHVSTAQSYRGSARAKILLEHVVFIIIIHPSIHYSIHPSIHSQPLLVANGVGRVLVDLLTVTAPIAMINLVVPNMYCQQGNILYVWLGQTTSKQLSIMVKYQSAEKLQPNRTLKMLNW